MDDIEFAIAKVKNKTAPGPSGINVYHIKYLMKNKSFA